MIGIFYASGFLMSSLAEHSVPNDFKTFNATKTSVKPVSFHCSGFGESDKFLFENFNEEDMDSYKSLVFFYQTPQIIVLEGMQS